MQDIYKKYNESIQSNDTAYIARRIESLNKGSFRVLNTPIKNTKED